LINDNYSFGEITNFKKIKGGITNNSYSFYDSNKQKYFVKEYLRYPKSKILLSYKIKDSVAKKISSYGIIKTMRGQKLLSVKGRNIEVSKFIDDSKTINDLTKLTNKHIRETAKNLALFHKESKSLKSRMVFVEQFSFKKEKKIFLKVRDLIKKKKKPNGFDKRCLKLVNIKLNKMKKYKCLFDSINRKKLSVQINHGDFIPTNCFFDKKGVFKHLIDFEHALLTYRLYDITKTTLFMSRKEQHEIANSGVYDFKRIKIFLEEYNKYNKLTKEEIELFPKMAFCLSIRSFVIVSGFYLFKNKKVQKLLPKKDLEYYYSWWENNYSKCEDFLSKAFNL